MPDTANLTPEEEDAHEKIIDAFEAIKGLGLEYNMEELVHAVHAMQHFVSMHALHRLIPEFYGDWYSKD